MLLKESTMARHSDLALRRNFLRAGTLKKSCSTETVVPCLRETDSSCEIAPPSADTEVPSPPSTLVSIWNREIEAIAGSASPRNPKLETPTRSDAILIFEVP